MTQPTKLVTPPERKLVEMRERQEYNKRKRVLLRVLAKGLEQARVKINELWCDNNALPFGMSPRVMSPRMINELYALDLGSWLNMEAALSSRSSRASKEQAAGDTAAPVGIGLGLDLGLGLGTGNSSER